MSDALLVGISCICALFNIHVGDEITKRVRFQNNGEGEVSCGRHFFRIWLNVFFLVPLQAIFRESELSGAFSCAAVSIRQIVENKPNDLRLSSLGLGRTGTLNGGVDMGETSNLEN